MTTSHHADKRVFHALDAARGIAALVVVVYHLPNAMRGNGFGSGHLAVDFFFGLSGFVLAHAYLGKLSSGQMSLREFALVRLIRLYPLYLFSLLMLLVFLAGMLALSKPIPWSTQALAGKLPFALLMLPSPSGDPQGYLYPFNVAAWSILFELGINLVFAMFCARILNSRTRWAVVIVSGLLFALQLIWQDEVGGASWNTLLAGVPRVFFSFFLGIQIHEWHSRRAATRPAKQGLWSLIALAVLFGCLYAPAHLWFKLAAIFVIFPVLIMVLSFAELPRGKVGDGLAQLGVLSYAIYVVHGTVLQVWMSGYAAAGLPLPTSGLTFMLLIGAVLAVSWLADRWFDRPVRSWLQAMLRRRFNSGSARALPASRP
ncbi:acyltransferase [Variovorax sp. J22R133]|uniref:acyltransferase family protein n=1 Tax=Variovorax brevis TaxID=3053503 RepID=UPI00257505B4|nr:acyltransferase [Variovorax sp. J22R133]MDM0111944.1 acyltransferase [Variovorax sp. J22R133]